MNCKDALNCISEYLDGALSMSEVRDIEAHLVECPGCTKELETTQEMLTSLRSLSGAKSPVDCWEHVRVSIQPKQFRQPVWWRWALRPLVAVPTVATVAVLALFLAWPSSRAPKASDRAFAPEYNYYIGAHSHLQRQQAFVDPDVVYMGAELQKASLVANSNE